MKYRGHEIKQWDHYRTPRAIDGFYPDSSNVGSSGDRIVFWCAAGIFLLMIAGWI